MAKVHEKQKVIALRKEGYSYKEIMKRVPNIAKGTLSIWCRHIEMSQEQIQRLENHMEENRDRARIQSAITNHNKRLERDALVYKDALKKFDLHKKDSLFILGIALYWGEGAKTTRYFQFTNSDPVMTKIMIAWIEKYLGMNRNSLKTRLYIHKSYENKGLRSFWSKQIDIPENKFHRDIYKKDKYGFKKNPNYKGCIRIDAPGVENWVKTMAWKDILVDNVKI